MKIRNILGYFLIQLLGSYKEGIIKAKIHIFPEIEEDYPLMHKSIFQIGLFEDFCFVRGRLGVKEDLVFCLKTVGSLSLLF